jgi:hypothetical protein
VARHVRADLGGLRQHGNYILRVRTDINEVIAALTGEASWVVVPDGTTFPSSSSASEVCSFPFCPCQFSSDRAEKGKKETSESDKYSL